jgi:molybdopterin converting factor small subunit
MATIRIPPTLRAEVGGVRELDANGGTVADVIDDLVARFPSLEPQLLRGGELADFVNVYVRGEDVRTREGLDTEVAEGDQLILLPALAGGSPLTPSRRPRAAANAAAFRDSRATGAPRKRRPGLARG